MSACPSVMFEEARQSWSRFIALKTRPLGAPDRGLGHPITGCRRICSSKALIPPRFGARDVEADVRPSFGAIRFTDLHQPRAQLLSARNDTPVKAAAAGAIGPAADTNSRAVSSATS